MAMFVVRFMYQYMKSQLPKPLVIWCIDSVYSNFCCMLCIARTSSIECDASDRAWTSINLWFSTSSPNSISACLVSGFGRSETALIRLVDSKPSLIVWNHISQFARSIGLPIVLVFYADVAEVHDTSYGLPDKTPNYFRRRFSHRL